MDFVTAFNAQDLDALAAGLSLDATAVVEGSPFPVEQGRAAIRDTSLAYLTDQGLTAQVAHHADVAVLLLDEQGRLDVAVRIDEHDGQITALTYYTMPHRAEVVTAIAAACGLTHAPE